MDTGSRRVIDFAGSAQRSVAASALASSRARGWKVASALLATASFTVTAAWAWTHSGGAAAGTELRLPQNEDAFDPAWTAAGAAERAKALDNLLLARWESLRAAFLEAAAPVREALDRADRVREELPEWESRARYAEALYLTARRARERAEADEARYREEFVKLEQQAIRDQVTAAELAASQAQSKLDESRRTRQRLAGALGASGTSRETAEGAAASFYDKYVREGEIRFLQTQAALNQMKARQERLAQYEQPKRSKRFHAEVEARRAEELAWLAAWEKAKATQVQLETRLAKADLAPGEKRLFDRLVKVVLATGSHAPQNGDPAAFRAFLDKFEAELAEARAVSAQLRMKRYDGLVDQLLRAQERLGGREAE